MTITKGQLKKIMPTAPYTRIDKYLPYLNAAMTEFGILTKERAAHFLAQVAHESAEMRYTKELASGAAYDTGRKAIALGNTPQKDGDGQKYKGRGFIQLTGKANYERYKKFCGYDVVAKPELLELPKGATRSAAWFFTQGCGQNLCYVADLDNGKNTEMVLQKITRVINGGLNGLESRRKYLQRALKALG